MEKLGWSKHTVDSAAPITTHEMVEMKITRRPIESARIEKITCPHTAPTSAATFTASSSAVVPPYRFASTGRTMLMMNRSYASDKNPAPATATFSHGEISSP
jgi:hypothetical protein